MQIDLKQFRDAVKTLPAEDLDKLQKIIIEEQKAKKSKNGNKEEPDWQIERYKKARKWLDENSEKYMNQWVCLEGDKLIAHGEDALEVHNKAIELGIKSPFVHHIVEEPEFYMGGW